MRAVVVVVVVIVGLDEDDDIRFLFTILSIDLSRQKGKRLKREGRQEVKRRGRCRGLLMR
jgi:hypothetical protein